MQKKGAGEQARADGKMMIAMEHYPVLPGQPVLSLIGDARQGEARKLIETLSDHGVHLIFTGHMHNQSINVTETAKGNRFYDVCTGSVIGWPSFIRLVTVEDENTVDIKSIPTPEFDWDKKGLTSKEYLIAQFEKMIRTLITAMRDDPARFLRKVGIKRSPATEKVFHVIGKKLNKMTVGQFGRLLFVKAEKEIRNQSFVELAVRLVRSVFEGNQPFVEGTPEGDFLLKCFRRLSPFFQKLKDAQGEPLDFYETMKHTAGNYGIDDWCAAASISCNADTVINIVNVGESIVQGYNHPAFVGGAENGARITVNIFNTHYSSLTLNHLYLFIRTVAYPGNVNGEFLHNEAIEMFVNGGIPRNNRRMVLTDGFDVPEPEPVSGPETGTESETAPAPTGEDGKKDPCGWCGGTHSGLFAKLIGLFHAIAAFFAGLIG